MAIVHLIVSRGLFSSFSNSIQIPEFAITGRFALPFFLFLCVKCLSHRPFVRKDWERLFPQIDFNHFRFTDNFKIIIQLIWVMFVVQSFRYSDWLLVRQCRWLFDLFRSVFLRCRRLVQLATDIIDNHLKTKGDSEKLIQNTFDIVLYIVLFSLCILCLTVPFSIAAQLVFVSVLALTATLLHGVKGRLPNLLLIVLSLIASCRYIWWRYSSTINWDKDLDLVLGLILLTAETYSWIVLLLSYFQTIWPLNRQPKQLPKDTSKWPEIDLLIPTYNEDLDVVRATVFAAKTVDWPQDKLNIYILDDGKRDDFKHFAEQVGVGYFRRPTNEHAKAGNLNYALERTSGEFVAIFDCDHIPTRAFFQVTMGEFVSDDKLALVQTPHHFFSPDPFERNLSKFRELPNEGNLFYGLIQDGNDMWDATFFCGSCAILRRQPLEEVGGVAVETVTEDAHTALKMHRLGYRSAYLKEPISAGLATDSLSAHIGQRIRWARGMAQIFRVDNPLFGSGLKWQQRLCYLNGMMHFLSGIPRLIFMIAPLAFLLLDAYIIYAPALAILMFVLPHIFHANVANSRIQGKYRHSFWGEIYETVLAWYIAVPTTIALFAPNKGNFNVTQKGGLIQNDFFDWNISKPIIILLCLNLLGFAVGIQRLFDTEFTQTTTVLVNMGWTMYNLIVLGVALSVAAEEKQVRIAHRIDVDYPISFTTRDGHHYTAILKDFSFSGLGMNISPNIELNNNETIRVVLERYGVAESFEATVMFSSHGKVGVALEPMTIEKEKRYIQCTFARSDTWSKWQKSYAEDKPLASLKNLLIVSVEGFRKLVQFGPRPIEIFFDSFVSSLRLIVSYRPRMIG
ncbi:UDP-forming cellulose synthase catalytic subunit [Vibrio sp. ZSDZ34]|uniref:Cellulose synthase catalytic subunit [UDP-forming] n=1 Tax=Vibrio gelatinilyticus TaxID=2893468 RepID=A0A9X1WCB5_9VIBR|nr:UDP-forming cellulose synthase catalytic subunit [Vibrio gelatinilyticus]MCJ2376523.1 UDP-forming cellulose synthase catalytic subunit [Vibrio gelatinilyticus]